jgi:lipopolysaccharide transport system permease protein
VARELKARYRGSVLGVFWSFVNPLLRLLIFTFVFAVVLPGVRGAGLEPYPLFLLCGILPWTWFESALTEASTVLISGGNLIRKVLFPAEVLPIVTVLAGLVHFVLGMGVYLVVAVIYGLDMTWIDLVWLPGLVAVQALFTIGLALPIAALTVHFRDIRDLLANLIQLWFYATPIIYALSEVPSPVQAALRLNPMTHLMMMYQEILFRPGAMPDWWRLAIMAAAAVVMFVIGYAVFDRMRDTLAEEV